MVGDNFDYSPENVPYLLGQMTQALRGLGRSLDQDRQIANDRHRENTENIQEIGKRVGTMEDTVKPIATSVKKMEPIFESFMISKWKMTGAIGVVIMIVMGIGWAVAQFAAQIGTALFSRG